MKMSATRAFALRRRSPSAESSRAGLGRDAATELQKTADETEAAAWAQVVTQDAKSDAAIGAIRDAIWNGCHFSVRLPRYALRDAAPAHAPAP